MSDIVERLLSDRGAGRVHWADCAEAADEIEHLRRQIAWCRPRLSKEIYRAQLDRNVEDRRKPDGLQVVQSATPPAFTDGRDEE